MDATPDELNELNELNELLDVIYKKALLFGIDEKFVPENEYTAFYISKINVVKEDPEKWYW